MPLPGRGADEGGRDRVGVAEVGEGGPGRRVRVCEPLQLIFERFGQTIGELLDHRPGKPLSERLEVAFD